MHPTCLHPCLSFRYDRLSLDSGPQVDADFMEESAPTKAATLEGRPVAPSAPCLLARGLNWATFASTSPFHIVELCPAPANDHRPGHPHDVKRTSPPTLAQAQLPVVSVAAGGNTLAWAAAAPTACIVAKADVVQRVRYVATVWCLQPSSQHVATLRWSTHDGAGGGTETARVTFCTGEWQVKLDLRAEALHIVDDGTLLLHPEFTRCITAQGTESFMLYVPPDIFDVASAAPFFKSLWYHGLFSLPEVLEAGQSRTAILFALPNGEDRYTLDLAPTPTEAVTQEPAPTTYAWRRQSKVRRVIRSGAYAVVVRDDAAGVMASLHRATAYHTERSAGTWLHDDFIRAMGLCCGGSASRSRAAGDPAHDVRLLTIELVERATGDVVAGCCGMAVGRAYHDYTMYTLKHTKDSFGTFLTKLIGEALQQCGYTLWYWGFCVEYMREFEPHFGATNMPREVFYRRWTAARDAAPVWKVESYLRSHKGMVPYYEAGGDEHSC
ncbi:hypothetical protein NESM_000469100 [Novymonas esmeraldas]|uniref:Uncharacterized protein n=1 Tax=Novymonas esmeraldas TaxID=1808958 RepID=A0AAW0EQJ8_9TRYP